MSLSNRTRWLFSILTALLLAATSLGLSKGAKHKAKRKQRTGAELYQMSCNRCHSERYPTERTDAQWKTILLHMRIRAQLPAKDARLILKYLQENN